MYYICSIFFKRPMCKFELAMNNTEPKSHHLMPIPIRVIHIDDDPIFLKCVKETLEKQDKIEIVHQFTEASAFLTCLPDVAPFDVLIIDYIMPGMTGAELIAQLKALHIAIPIISFTSHDFPEYANQLLKEGINSCLPKNRIRYLEALVLECVSNQDEKREQHHAVNLTPTEIDLIACCCENLSRIEMAERLYVGMDAVKARKVLLAKKLGIENENIHFLKWAIKKGLFKV